jgi:hypothetical protein
MPGQLCEECNQTVPRARLCPECGSLSEAVHTGKVEDDDVTEHFSQIALDGSHESVSFDTLRSKHDSYDKPLGSYLLQGEQPEVICKVKSGSVEGVDDSFWNISAGVFDLGHFLVTDERIVAIFPREDEPQLIDVPFTDTVAVDDFSNWRTNKLIIEDLQGYQYEFFLRVDEGTFETLIDVVRDLNQTVDSEGSTAVKFVNKIDAEVAAADDAESVLYAIAELFEERSEMTHFDQAVAESDSIEELGEQMAGIPGTGISDNKRPEAQSTNTLARPENDATGIGQRVTQAARNADRTDVAKYSLGAVLGFGTAAVSAPISTTVGIAGLLAGGAATGAYASTHPDSIVARINPLQLAMNSKRRGSQLASNPGAGGQGTGAALGMVEYLGQMNDDELDEAYAKWLSEVDIESVMEGQKVAYKYSNKTGEFDNPKQASILGGAAGLAYGYTNLEGDIDETFDDNVVDDILDDPDNTET